MRVIRAWIVLILASGGAIAADARGLAARIDARLAARWAEAGVRPSARADDAEFLRRASLDLIGTIPTAAEARDFLDDPDPGKRNALVDRLLDSPAYAERAALLWRGLLLPDAEAGAQVAVGPLDAWLRKKVAEEAGYDRIVREVLAAKLASSDDRGMVAAGIAATTEPSPASFYTARAGKPEVIASDAARAFLGIRLECAQCHHHPFAKWKREEFWGFAAFFAGVPGGADDANANARMTREDPTRRALTIPGTSTTVKAAHLDGTPPAWRPRAGTRDVLAEWLTAPNNPYFARAAVNRTWARFFGNGLIDPIDDLDAGGDPALLALLDEVASAFRDGGYDLKFLIRALTATRAYNLTSAAPPDTSGSAAPTLFARMPVRGLSPGQFVDSLARATGTDQAEARARLLGLFADRDEPPTEAKTTILQALTLMNGAFVSGATRPETGDLLGAVAEAPYLDTAGRVDVLFLAALTRHPRPDERDLIVKYIERRGSEAERTRALSDAFWAILNGPEFRINH